MERAEKRELVGTLNEVFKNTGVVVVAHYQGLTVAQLQTLRGQMRAAGGSVKVAKNRLVKLALQGTDAEHISDLFTGPTVIAYSADPVTAPKVASDFAKTNDKFVILGGAMGATNLSPDGVKALATLPSLDELRGKLVGMIQRPPPASRVSFRPRRVSSPGCSEPMPRRTKRREAVPRKHNCSSLVRTDRRKSEKWLILASWSTSCRP
ncbi:50S ribosomal protein L10 [Methylobrevis pamukkalensis]|uniref:Large ribosomal subunit protein uL10 n=1 Tax=Methylobrevis pamukkalensis TaxID=1439726 RepID=A0A1E3GZE3_9HYPH|nr:50S ribosomal protein L10 [Methylobrevis pamukkalensis]